MFLDLHCYHRKYAKGDRYIMNNYLVFVDDGRQSVNMDLVTRMRECSIPDRPEPLTELEMPSFNLTRKGYEISTETGVLYVAETIEHINALMRER